MNRVTLTDVLMSRAISTISLLQFLQTICSSYTNHLAFASGRYTAYPARRMLQPGHRCKTPFSITDTLAVDACLHPGVSIGGNYVGMYVHTPVCTLYSIIGIHIPSAGQNVPAKTNNSAGRG